MRRQFGGEYEDIVSLENLFAAWKEFVKGKRGKCDVQEFGLRLTDNIIELHEELANKTYKHGSYQSFHITDPKPRHIHKASVRDRVLHHAIYRKLYPFFDRTFIADSFSCRLNKGTHKALKQFPRFSWQVSRNHTRTAWVLKCDIRKFFASVNHRILFNILETYILDKKIMWLLERVITSFFAGKAGVGLPLGNLTSQLFCNIYMNEFDTFVKHKLKAKYYIRYADDFILMSEDRSWLFGQLPVLKNFLLKQLMLSLHQNKISLETLASGIDFLGWVHFPKHLVLRTVTKRRMMGRIMEKPKNETLQSYLGLLSHGDTIRLQQQLQNSFGLWRKEY